MVVTNKRIVVKYYAFNFPIDLGLHVEIKYIAH
jgi:hypothetical protein